MFDEFIKEITKELEAKESRSRATSAAPHARFKYAVSFLVGELWRNSMCIPQVKAQSISGEVTIPNYPGIGMRT